MIESLYIKDYALIDELDVSFGPGLSILTGQTGAGKSIIIGALNLVLGERAETESIRTGAAKAIAEVSIRIPDDAQLRALLDDAGIEYAGALLLRREVREAGSRAFINDTPVTVSVLKQVGDLLVDLHGQHDHQLFLREEEHRKVIDALPAVRPALEHWQAQYVTVQTLKLELNRLRKRESELTQKLELSQYQLKELEAARIDADEIGSMVQEMKLLDSAEELDLKAGMVVDIGSDGDPNVMDMLTRMEKALLDLADIEPGFGPFHQEFSAARISIDEAVRYAERYRSSIEHNPARLEYLRGRQSELRRLEKKYGKSPEELLVWMEELRQEIHLAENFDVEIAKLAERLEAESARLKDVGVRLTAARADSGRQLSAALVDVLATLGLPYAVFDVRQEPLAQPTEFGASDVRFFISTNRGEAPKPLAKTASGGEISRIMLALKSVIAREQRLPVMIFDEIDTGISGAVAEKVGQTMRALSRTCQILAITHQPQIASQAHTHYVVAKDERNDRTLTTIRALSADEHIREVAVLMSGESVTDAALTSARQLIERATAG